MHSQVSIRSFFDSNSTDLLWKRYELCLVKPKNTNAPFVRLSWEECHLLKGNALFSRNAGLFEWRCWLNKLSHDNWLDVFSSQNKLLVWKAYENPLKECCACLPRYPPPSVFLKQALSMCQSHCGVQNHTMKNAGYQVIAEVSGQVSNGIIMESEVWDTHQTKDLKVPLKQIFCLINY